MMKKVFVKKSFVLVLVALVMVLVLVGTVLAMGTSQRSEAPVYWSWDVGGEEVGTSSLVRNGNGISANYKTDVLTPGNAATLWFVVFNNPGECLGTGGLEQDDECTPLDFGNTAAQGDFFLASGHVIDGNGKGNFGGSLKVGDTSRSGLAEVLKAGGCVDEACETPGLIDPANALVLLAIHDHGPAQTGQTLKEQISSFLGGCVGDFNGNEFGFAEGLGDIPDAEGECSTIQFSPHMPPTP